MVRVQYTLAMNVYLVDFCSLIMVCLVNFAAAHTLANPNDVRLCCHTEHECQEHSLYCHLNASQLKKIQLKIETTVLSITFPSNLN